jgi:hypothetical protein
MPITSNSFAKALWPGVNAWYQMGYADHKEEWPDLFDKNTSNRKFEEDVGYSGFGLASVKTEGAPITYDSEKQGFTARYTHVTYALGFIVTREMFEDDLYDVVGQKKAKALARSMRHTKEQVAANVYNRAFTGAYAGPDGLELCSTAHLNVAGGTYANELATAADLSEASLEQAVIDLEKFTDDRGLKIAVMPKALIIPVDLQFEATRILKSDGRVGTADNDLNAIKTLGVIPKIVINHWLTDADAWFIRTNVQDGMKYFSRREDAFAMDNDFDTENAKFKATARYSFGWSDPKQVFGSPGA